MTPKYIISKADGSPVDKDAKYLVLRYDHKASKSIFRDAAYEAILSFITTSINHKDITQPELDIVNNLFDDMQDEKELIVD